MADDKGLILEEIRNAIESIEPGEDGITGEIYKRTFENFPNYITAINNKCLRRRVFPVRRKRAEPVPIRKHGKENKRRRF